MATETKEKLTSSLEHLREDIKVHRKSRLLGPLVEDFTSRLLGLKNQGGMDVVTEALEGMTKEIEEEIKNLPSILPAPFWSPPLLTHFLKALWDPSSRARRLLDEANSLLKETVERRRPRTDIYRLAFYSQLPERSYGLHRHFKGMPLPPKRFADMIHCRHKQLEEICKVTVMTNETVVIIDAASKEKEFTEVMDSILDTLQYALKCNEEYPEADERATFVFAFGENSIRSFDSRIIAHCSDKLAGRLYEDVDCRFLLENGKRWWSRINGLNTEYKLAIRDNGGRRFYSETLQEKTQMQSLRRDTREEIHAWNSDVPVRGAASTTETSDDDDDDDTPVFIEGSTWTLETLVGKINSILGIPVVSGCIALSRASVDVRGGFALVYQIDVSRSAEMKSILPPQSEFKHVAVKLPILDENLSLEAQYLRMVRELRTWSRLKHKNIITLLGVWTGFLPESTIPAFISPWMSQGPITSLITPNSHISIVQRFKFLHDIASALEYMHYHDFRTVHGDVKGDNVLVDNDKAYLCDFGLSKIYDGVDGFEKGLRGNWRWLAPEMFDVEDDGRFPDPTTEGDVFAFGCLMLEVLSGCLPYLGVEDHKGISKRSEDKTFVPCRPPSIPDGAHWYFCLSCWKESPTLRPTAKEARQKMEEFIEKARKKESANRAFIQRDILTL